MTILDLPEMMIKFFHNTLEAIIYSSVEDKKFWGTIIIIGLFTLFFIWWWILGMWPLP